jgi:hypothetical protein
LPTLLIITDCEFLYDILSGEIGREIRSGFLEILNFEAGVCNKLGVRRNQVDECYKL